MLRRELLGDWRLIAMGATNSAGETVYPMGRHAEGLLVYTEGGHVSVNIGQFGRSRPPGAAGLWSGLDDATAATMARTYMAYAGTYTVDEAARTVVHHLDFGLDPFMVAHPQVRQVSFNDDGCLVLDAFDDASGTRGFLVWARA
jgi:hypothetical protein